MNNTLSHFGILGMKWGVRRYQNPDGSLTSAGRKRYNKTLVKQQKPMKKNILNRVNNADSEISKKADKMGKIKLDNTITEDKHGNMVYDKKKLNSYLNEQVTIRNNLLKKYDKPDGVKKWKYHVVNGESINLSAYDFNNKEIDFLFKSPTIYNFGQTIKHSNTLTHFGISYFKR